MHNDDNPTILEFIFAQLLPIAERRESEGAWEYYFDEKLGVRVETANGNAHGKFQMYYPNGQVAFEGAFDRGERGGETTYFRKNGTVWGRAPSPKTRRSREAIKERG